MVKKKKMWSETESNRRHGDFQSPALPAELPDHFVKRLYISILYTEYVNKKSNKKNILSKLPKKHFSAPQGVRASS